MRAYHFPFSLVNITTVLLFAAGTYQNRQNIFSLYEGIKIAIFLLLSSTMFILIREQRKITTNDYIFKWKRLK